MDNTRVNRLKSVLIAILLFIFGIVFIAVPESSYNTISKVLAWALIVVGAILIVFYLLNFNSLDGSGIFIEGLLILGLGLVLMFWPYLDIVVIGVGLGLAGISFIGTSLDQKRDGYIGWWKILVYGVIELAIGAVLVALHYSGATDGYVTIFLGASLIVGGIFILATIAFMEKEEEEETEE